MTDVTQILSQIEDGDPSAAEPTTASMLMLGITAMLFRRDVVVL